MKDKNSKQKTKSVQLQIDGVLAELNTVPIKSEKTKKLKVSATEIHSKINKAVFGEEVLTETELLKILIRFKNGNFSVRLPQDESGPKGAIYKVLNEIIDQNDRKVFEITKLEADFNKEEVFRKANEALKGEAVLLTAQKSKTELKNKEVEEARKLLEEKANQLALISKYKSEFLANMSHELRTPLNSLQILAHELIENHDGNLTPKQIQFAKTIKVCGEELVDLINDILDLSKIESGYISVDNSRINFSQITNYIENTFRPVSEIKQLRFTIETENDLPEFIETDSQRLNQILKNLLSNSFKFTEKGSVLLKIYKTNRKLDTKLPNSNNTEMGIAFEIFDTGIGISEEKQNIIFEAFQQAEGSTSRKYGGTGLGLSISRGLAHLLGGVIEIESVQEEGSKFTLFLPLKYTLTVEAKQTEWKPKINLPNTIKISAPSTSHFSEIDHYFENEMNDDRLTVVAEDKVILIIDEDILDAKLILEKAHKNGLKVIATTQKSEAIDFLIEFKPQSIFMNINSNTVNCWNIMNRIKNDLSLRHIPVYITSHEKNKDAAYIYGARKFSAKPLDEEKLSNLFNDSIDFNNKKIKSLLIINENESELEMIVKAVEHSDIKITVAKTANQAIDLIHKTSFDCIILDPILTGALGFEVIKGLVNTISEPQTSFIIYSEKMIDTAVKTDSYQFPIISILKTTHSLGKLVNQISLFLHRVHKVLPEKMKELINVFYLSDNVLLEKKILIVDDDMRNLFVLTNALERYGFVISNAESGQEAISKLENNTIDLILMDIMMPEMDGYETMQRIRKSEKNNTVTIIALTAKAMKGDRQKCIKSGASDYITKPINIERLLNLMRIWLKQGT